jgi:hypothetical protein
VKIGNVTIPAPQGVEPAARTIKIHYNKNVAAVIEMKKRDILIADVQVIEGASVNVLFMDEIEFSHYSHRQPYRFYRDGTRLDTCRVIFSTTAPMSCKYYLVVENSGFTSGGAEPDILNNSGIVIVRMQVLVGIPGTARKSIADSALFSMFPVGSGPSELEERLIYGEAGAPRKRNISFHSI